MNPFKTHKETITGNVRNVIESSKGLPKTRTLDESLNDVTMPKDNHYQNCLLFAMKELKSLYKQGLIRITSETLKKAYNKQYPNEIPKEPRVWGNVIKILAKDGFLIGAGYTKYQDPIGHGRPSRMWIVSNKNS